MGKHKLLALFALMLGTIFCVLRVSKMSISPLIASPYPASLQENNASFHNVQDKTNQSPIHYSWIPQLAFLDTPVNVPPQHARQRSPLVQAVARYASDDGSILISVVDLGFAEMAINLFLTCMKPQAVENYLIVAIHPHVCAILEEHDIHCFTYKTIQFSDKASSFNTKEYNMKTTMRADVILETLKAGYSVFHTDADAICFKNPFNYFNCSKEDCDLAVMVDYVSDNYAVGCDFINPTNASILLYSLMITSAQKGIQGIDQHLFINSMKEVKKTHPDFIMKKLSMEEFVSGKAYYKVARRDFADEAPPCPKCVMAQNNWIITYEAKRYRAKELHHWLVDTDQYYSSTARKYITFDNHKGSKGADNLNALFAAFAMGEILNRTVVLPKFFCGEITCNMLHTLKLSTFDTVFQYREHSFLTHPLVPEVVKTSVYGPVLVDSHSALAQKLCKKSGAPGLHIVTPSSLDKGLNSDEVIAQFRPVKESVLKFQCLYGSFDKYVNDQDDKRFRAKWKKGAKGSWYLQG